MIQGEQLIVTLSFQLDCKLFFLQTIVNVCFSIFFCGKLWGTYNERLRGGGNQEKSHLFQIGGQLFLGHLMQSPGN